MNLFEFVKNVFTDIPPGVHNSDFRMAKAIALTAFHRHIKNVDPDISPFITPIIDKDNRLTVFFDLES